MPRKRKKVTEYVLCFGPVGLPDSTVMVEVSPGDPFEIKKVRVRIASSAIREGFPEHEVAWAAGYYVIDVLSEGQLRIGDDLQILTVGELEGRISDAPDKSMARWAVRCPRTECRRPAFLPKGEIRTGKKSRYEGFRGTVTCQNGHSFLAEMRDLCVHVEPLPPLLERGKA